MIDADLVLEPSAVNLADRTLTLVLAELTDSARRPGTKKDDLTYRRGQFRFKVLCVELFRRLPHFEPKLQLAYFLVKGVETGQFARCKLAAEAERATNLTPEERAFALGMACGFMTEFLPRPAD